MKIKQSVIKKNKLIKLQLLKIKSYKKNYFYKAFKIEDIEYRLIKTLKIIYKYNNLNKIIFFLNNYLTIETKLKSLLKKTNHLYFSKNYLLKDIINYSFLLNKLKQSVGNSLILKNKVDLKVLLNKKITKMTVKKNYNAKIPNIFFHEDEFISFTFKSNYKVLGNFFHKKNQFFFIFILLNCLFKKSKQIKN